MSQHLAPVPVGIDIGTYKSKIAIAKRGGVQVITNQANFRQTPCIVGFGKQQRQIGQNGHSKIKSNFKDTIVSPTRFLGIDGNYPLLTKETKFTPAKTNINDGKIRFQVNYQGQKLSISPEQVMAAYFNKLKLIIAKNGYENKDVVISVPTYLTQAQRKAYFDAAKIAELNIRLINDSTAVALDYGLFRKSDLDAHKPRNVLFIDFGHSKLGLFVCSFTKTEMNVLQQEYSRNVGCRDIDYLLYEFYRNLFEKTSGGLDLSESKKAYVKLMQNIEKQRKVLSGNLQHDISIECLMEQNDLNYTMRRQEFESISEPIFNQAERVLVKVRQQLKAREITLHSIEMVGGGTRIPIFLRSVKQVFGIECSRTLNSSESAARGCALEAAIKSPLFKVQQYTLNERVYNGVRLCWNFVEGNNYLGMDSTKYPEAQCKMIYGLGAKVPSVKTVKFKRKQSIEILIQYQPSVNGFSKHIGYYKTQAQNPQHEIFGVSFKIKYNQHGLITFEDCNLVEEWTEQTKTPEKKQARKLQGQGPAVGQVRPQLMEQQGSQIKKAVKERHNAIKYQCNQMNPTSEEQIKEYLHLQRQLLSKDSMILQTYQKKNELQSLSYKWREYLSSSHKDYAKPEDIPAILKLLDQNSQWLYGDGQHATREAYSDRIAKVNAKVLTIRDRRDNFELVLGEVAALLVSLDSHLHLLNSSDSKYAHITPQQKQQSVSCVQKCRSWIMNIQQKQTTKNRWQDPATNINELRSKAQQVNDNVKKTMGKPVPKPAGTQKKYPNNQKMDMEPKSKQAKKILVQGNPAGEVQKPEKMQTQ